MKLCVINNIIMLLIIIVLGKISYNILRNKKNYETFTNGWSLNHDGELCYESDCKDIAVLGSGDSGKICTISGNTLECDKIEESAVADGDEGAVAESVANGGSIQGCMDSGATNYKPDATLPGSCTYNNIVYSVDATGVKDNNLEFNNDTKELIAKKPIIEIKATDVWNDTLNIKRLPVINTGKFTLDTQISSYNSIDSNGAIGLVADFSNVNITTTSDNYAELSVTFKDGQSTFYNFTIVNGNVDKIQIFE